MSVIRYKLTDEHGCTRNNTQWGEGVTHTAPGEGPLCSPGWIHVYTDPLLAVLLNPIHGAFTSPLLWECLCAGASLCDYGLKEGWAEVTTVRRLELPAVTTAQRIAFCILVAKEVCTDEAWNGWADAWLSGVDRSWAAEWAATWRAAGAAARAAEWAAWAARRAAEAVETAAALATERAATAAAAADVPIDLIALAKRAVGEY